MTVNKPRDGAEVSLVPTMLCAIGAVACSLGAGWLAATGTVIGFAVMGVLLLAALVLLGMAGFWIGRGLSSSRG